VKATTNEEVELASTALYLGTTLASWFAGRASRKVRLKVGDVEVEAYSMKEVDQLFEKVRESLYPQNAPE
jgi:hypothetical protein